MKDAGCIEKADALEVLGNGQKALFSKERSPLAERHNKGDQIDGGEAPLKNCADQPKTVGVVHRTCPCKRPASGRSRWQASERPPDGDRTPSADRVANRERKKGSVDRRRGQTPKAPGTYLDRLLPG